MARKYGKKASEKIGQTMHEFKRGKLKSGGSGKKVTSRKQAIAIGISQARREGYKVPPEPTGHATMSLDQRVRAHLSNMRPGEEIDARGIARALGGVDPLAADYALERAQKAGLAVTSDGRWFGPRGGAVHHATKKRTPQQLDREIAQSLASQKQPELAALFADPAATKVFAREMRHEIQKKQTGEKTAAALAARPFTVKHLERSGDLITRALYGRYPTEAEARAQADKLHGWVEHEGRVVYGRAQSDHSTRRRSHSTIKSDEQIAERRKRDPGAWSSRAQLVTVARRAAENVFSARKVMTPALIKKARAVAFKAIQRHDPLSGTSEHPAAAYAHGVAALAAEGTSQAERAWVPAQKIRR